MSFPGIFMPREEKMASTTSDAVNDALDWMPTFWQEIDAPVEHVLTT